MNFYKRFMGDYGRSTGHLTLVEHGAYGLMLDAFYSTSKPLPGNKKALYRLLRAESDLERKAVDAVSLQFWRPIPDDFDLLYTWLGLHVDDQQLALRTVAQEWAEASGLINVRALGEMVKAQIVADKNRKTAIEREAKKREQANKGGQL